MNVEIISALVAVVIAVAGFAIAFGKLKKNVEFNTKAIKGCHMDHLVTTDGCDNKREQCTDRLDLILTNMAGQLEALKADVKEDMQEIKTDVNAEKREFSEYREKTAGALGRIETTLHLLVNGTGRND